MTTAEFQELLEGISFGSFNDWRAAKEVATRAAERERKRCAQVATDHAKRHDGPADRLEGNTKSYAIGMASAGHEIARDILKDPCTRTTDPLVKQDERNPG